MPDRCLNLSDREARAVPSVLVRPVGWLPTHTTEAKRLPGSARIWRFFDATMQYTGHLNGVNVKSPCAPSDVLCLREGWRVKHHAVGRPSLAVVEYKAGGTRKIIGSDAWLLEYPAGKPPHWRTPQHMLAPLARHRRKVVSVEPMKVLEISDEVWVKAGFKGTWDPTGAGVLSSPDEDAEEEWKRRYGKAHPWETAWGWVIGMGG